MLLSLNHHCITLLQEDLGNSRAVNLTLLLGWSWSRSSFVPACSTCSTNRELSPVGFIKGRFCLINLISFYEKSTCFVDEGKDVDVANLKFWNPLTPFPMAFFWRKWLLTAWTGMPFTGWKTGWMVKLNWWWWSYIQLVASHKCSPGLSIGASLI